MSDYIRLHNGGYAGAVDPQGAALRSLTHDGADLVEPSRGVEGSTFAGALLAPWPNRIGDATYDFDGAQHRLPVNESRRGHAIHGLAYALDWDVLETSADSVRLGVQVPTQPGWPFRLALAVEYQVSSDGLTARLAATNIGDTRLPYGCGTHPYLVCGEGTVDDAELTLPAATRLETDDAMLLVGSAPVDQVDADFRTPTAIGDRFLDHCFTDISTGPQGDAWARLRRPGGRGVAIGWGAWARWVQVHTPVRSVPAEHRHSLAVEPMSCPPDAFRSGSGLVVLAPGERHDAWWRITATLDDMSHARVQP
ncbi:aldose 1-epimerase family protein [soil metagenome]